MTFSEVTNINPIFNLVPWIVFLPLVGLLLNLIIGKYLGEKGIGVIGSCASGLAFVVSVLLTVVLWQHQHPVSVYLADWITVGEFDLSWTFRVDTLSALMMLTVTGVGTLIHIYAIGYMHDDVRHNGDPGRFQRFFIFFNLFILAMMILITADNFLMLFVGWEGVGLCSYLLIGFWYEKGADGIGNAQAGKKAFIVNRIGDFGLLIALFIMFGAFGSLQFDAVFESAPQVSSGIILAITLFMILGVAGKSAQLPLYVWLPDAMAGPTPVSALIHAATMVTAGVYLVVRSAPLYELAPLAQDVVTWVGALTAIFAATIAVGQYDIKRVLAYSTISQLGFMVAAAGMGAYVAAMFHLVTHAFFKALLFLSSGSVIQGVERGMHAEGHGHSESDLDPQDMRFMGGLQRRMPITFWVYLIGALALSGIAPLAGFFSKDEILAAAGDTSFVVYIILSLAAFLTAFYMGRQIFMVFFGKARTAAAQHATESPLVVTVPLIILAVLSLTGGGLNLPGVHTLGQWLEHTVEHSLEVEFAWSVALISFALALLGLFFAWTIYGRRSLGDPENPDPLAGMLGPVFTALNKKWWVDELYGLVFVRPYTYLSEVVFAKWIDQKVIDGAANGLGSVTQSFAGVLRRLENGYVRSYALSILFGVVVILAYLILK
ncbi:MAG: NADH-quinone oxidoreductase subunit L [Anaerolineaceae bacterium]|nr:NADH-quinone oxidoreductase subunit L [Anaerolineaceae bacterium]